MNGANSLNDEFNENLFFHWLCTNNLLYINYPPDIIGKFGEKYRKIVLNFLKMRIFLTKIFSFWENWGQLSVFFSWFSHDFCQCSPLLKAVVYVSIYNIITTGYWITIHTRLNLPTILTKVRNKISEKCSFFHGRLPTVLTNRNDTLSVRKCVQWTHFRIKKKGISSIIFQDSCSFTREG